MKQSRGAVDVTRAFVHIRLATCIFCTIIILDLTLLIVKPWYKTVKKSNLYAVISTCDSYAHAMLLTLIVFQTAVAHTATFLKEDADRHWLCGRDVGVSQAIYQFSNYFGTRYKNTDMSTRFDINNGDCSVYNYGIADSIFFSLLVPANRRELCSTVKMDGMFYLFDGTTTEINYDGPRDLRYFSYPRNAWRTWHEDYKHATLLPPGAFYLEPFTATSYVVCDAFMIDKQMKPTTNSWVNVKHNGAPYVLTVGYEEQGYATMLFEWTPAYFAQRWNNTLYSRWLLFLPAWFLLLVSISFCIMGGLPEQSNQTDEKSIQMGIFYVLMSLVTWQVLFILAQCASYRDSARALPATTNENVLACDSNAHQFYLDQNQNNSVGVYKPCILPKGRSDANLTFFFVGILVPLLFTCVPCCITGCISNNQYSQDDNGNSSSSERLCKAVIYLMFGFLYAIFNTFTMSLSGPFFLLISLAVYESRCWRTICPCSDDFCATQSTPRRVYKPTASHVALDYQGKNNEGEKLINRLHR